MYLFITFKSFKTFYSKGTTDMQNDIFFNI